MVAFMRAAQRIEPFTRRALNSAIEESAVAQAQLHFRSDAKILTSVHLRPLRALMNSL